MSESEARPQISSESGRERPLQYSGSLVIQPIPKMRGLGVGICIMPLSKNGALRPGYAVSGWR